MHVTNPDALRAPVSPEDVHAELIAGLYSRVKPLLIANFGALGLLTIALWDSADTGRLLIWAVSLACWTMARFLLARAYLRRPRAAGEARKWAYAFAVGSGIAGCLWGSSVLLIENLEADNIKLVTAFLMAALSAAAIAGYTNSLLAFCAFVAPSLIPFGIKLTWLDGTFHWLVAAFVLFWGWLLWSMAKHLNNAFKDGIALTLQNMRLIERLSRAKDRAEQASLAKSHFLANMSHELRTPLNAIIGYSEMITGRILGPIGNPTYESYSNHVLQSGKHLLRIVEQVLDISRIEAGTIELARERIRVPDLVDNAIAFVAAAAAEDDIEIARQLPPDLPMLTGDAARLRQVLLQLLSNAVKFTPPHGRIEVMAERASGEGATPGLALTVADTGVGMTPDLVERATVPFWYLENKDHLRVAAPPKQVSGQTESGLGLPLSRLLVELHGGQLQISSAPGRGTRVRLWFPDAPTAATANQAGPGANAA